MWQLIDYATPYFNGQEYSEENQHSTFYPMNEQFLASENNIEVFCLLTRITRFVIAHITFLAPGLFIPREKKNSKNVDTLLYVKTSY